LGGAGGFQRKAYDFRRFRAPVPDGMTDAAGHEQGFMLTDRFFHFVKQDNDRSAGDNE
jgi:hypothetical protein